MDLYVDEKGTKGHTIWRPTGIFQFFHRHTLLLKLTVVYRRLGREDFRFALDTTLIYLDQYRVCTDK